MTSRAQRKHAPSAVGPGTLIALGAALCVAGFVVEYIAFAPGSMSYDTWVQLGQARSGQFGDSHPPIMAWVWSFLLTLDDGPRPMLILQLGVLWIALFVLFLHVARTAKFAALALAIPCVGILPWVANISGVVWKDVGMAFAWLACAALLARPRIGVLTATLAGGALMYGLMVRTNAIFGALPLLYLFATRIELTSRRPLISSVALLAVAMFSAYAITAGLIRPKQEGL